MVVLEKVTAGSQTGEETTTGSSTLDSIDLSRTAPTDQEREQELLVDELVDQLYGGPDTQIEALKQLAQLGPSAARAVADIDERTLRGGSEPVREQAFQTLGSLLPHTTAVTEVLLETIKEAPKPYNHRALSVLGLSDAPNGYFRDDIPEITEVLCEFTRYSGASVDDLQASEIPAEIALMFSFLARIHSDGESVQILRSELGSKDRVFQELTTQLLEMLGDGLKPISTTSVGHIFQEIPDVTTTGSYGKDRLHCSNETHSGRVEAVDRVMRGLAAEQIPAGEFSILDIGIGNNGITTIELAKSLKGRPAIVVGFDINPFNVYRARVELEKAQKRGDIPEGVTVFFEQADITTSPEEAASNPRNVSSVDDVMASLHRNHGVPIKALQARSLNTVERVDASFGPSSYACALATFRRNTLDDGVIIVGSGGRQSGDLTFKVFSPSKQPNSQQPRHTVDFRGNHDPLADAASAREKLARAVQSIQTAL